MEPSKTNQANGNDTTILSNHPYILCHTTKTALSLFTSTKWTLLSTAHFTTFYINPICHGQ